MAPGYSRSATKSWTDVFLIKTRRQPGIFGNLSAQWRILLGFQKTSGTLSGAKGRSFDLQLEGSSGVRVAQHDEPSSLRTNFSDSS